MYCSSQFSFFPTSFVELGFTVQGHNLFQDSSPAQMRPQASLATVMSTVETGKYGGALLDTIASLCEKL